MIFKNHFSTLKFPMSPNASGALTPSGSKWKNLFLDPNLASARKSGSNLISPKSNDAT